MYGAAPPRGKRWRAPGGGVPRSSESRIIEPETVRSCPHDQTYACGGHSRTCTARARLRRAVAARDRSAANRCLVAATDGAIAGIGLVARKAASPSCTSIRRGCRAISAAPCRRKWNPRHAHAGWPNCARPARAPPARCSCATTTRPAHRCRRHTASMASRSSNGARTGAMPAGRAGTEARHRRHCRAPYAPSTCARRAGPPGGRRTTVAPQPSSGTTAVTSISTRARSSISAPTCTAVIAG